MLSSFLPNMRFVCTRVRHSIKGAVDGEPSPFGDLPFSGFRVGQENEKTAICTWKRENHPLRSND